jgi:hypothetical protein
LFFELANFLVEGGAQIGGHCAVHDGPGIRDRRFAGITDEPLREVPVTCLAEVKRLISEPDVRVVQVDLHDVIGSGAGGAAVVTYQSISAKAAQFDRHPVAIWMDGWLFDEPVRKTNRAKARSTGKRVYRTFVGIADALRPEYAAITSDWPLECPIDLRRDPRTHAFQDFYLSGTVLKRLKLDSILAIFAGEYVERTAAGWYISATAEFNPAGTSSPADWATRAQRSTAVARLIGRAMGVAER